MPRLASNLDKSISLAFRTIEAKGWNSQCKKAIAIGLLNHRALNGAQARPLETLQLRFRPLAPHAIAWSCDAELAVALEDAIHVFLPEYPDLTNNEQVIEDELNHQFQRSLQASGLIRPEPSINGKLCAAAGRKITAPSKKEDFIFDGVGHGPATCAGAALSQIVRLEWSPNGLGHCSRPVLTALSTNGSILTLGEHFHQETTIGSSATSRSFRHWRVLWGLGASLPVPDGASQDGILRMNERIVSFSWAGEILSGRALLAYANDASEIVIISVQYHALEQTAETLPTREQAWSMCEVARFEGRGPHTSISSEDPDFVPASSAFSLKWSPWFVSSTYRTAALAYVANNFIGYRSVTVHGDWHKGQQTPVRVEQTDLAGICMPLSADAFVEWEEAIWTDGDRHVARGVIATPFFPKPFQIDLCASLSKPLGAHAFSDCSADLCNDEVSNNPITGLVIHPPDLENKGDSPCYSLVRLSATASNDDWYETNLEPQDHVLPQWAEYIRRCTTTLVPRATVMEGVDSDSEFEELEGGAVRDEGPVSRVHPYRFRFWGMASSPGGGCTAVLVTKTNTVHPHRRPRSSILFGWRGPGQEKSIRKQGKTHPNLTTEARLWEAVYGGHGSIADVIKSRNDPLDDAQRDGTRCIFQSIALQQRCVFCDDHLSISETESRCASGHTFDTCATTGLAIMAPGISRLCSVCGLRCLKESELDAIMKQYTVPEAVVTSMGDLCGACGGKFAI